VRKAGENPLEYLILTMKTSSSARSRNGGSGGEDRLTENVTLNFAGQSRLRRAGRQGGSRRQPKMGWDIAANKKL